MNQTRIWGDKPYLSLNYYLRKQYQEKIYKLSLDGGMTCPNRDGKISTGGCIFCSTGGSGDFAASRKLSIPEQIRQAKQRIHSDAVYKHTGDKYIAYFQAYTNTYAPISYLRKIYYEAIEAEDIVGLSIATRPDCIDDEVIELLVELNQIKPVWIELGLQTMHDDTAHFINRGYTLPVFEEAVEKLANANIETIVHIILGLPNEGKIEILQTIEYLNTKPIKGIKLQLLHVLKHTKLAQLLDQMHIFTRDEYVSLVIECLEHLRPDIVIHRLTGDGPKDLLLAPMWSTHKREVLNTIHKEMKKRNSYQGKFYKEV